MSELSDFDVVTVLKRAGFWLERDATHGTIWTDGYSKLLCPKEFLHQDAFKNFASQIAAAKERRHQTQILREHKPPVLQGKLFDVAKVEKEETEPVKASHAMVERHNTLQVAQEEAQAPPPPPSSRHEYRKKWTAEALELPFFKTFTELYQTEMTRSAIMARLRELGLKDPVRPDEFVDNDENFTNRLLLLNKIRQRAGMGPLRRAKGKGSKWYGTKPKPRTHSILRRASSGSAFVQIPDAVNSILLASGLSAEKKVAMALLWAEDASEELPEAILNVLTESAFTPELKVKMILALR